MGASHRTSPGGKFSEGSRLLWLAVEASGLNLARAAAEASCDRANFVKYIYGDRSPGRVDSVAIHQRFGVPLLSWDQKDLAAPFVLPALRPKAPASGADIAAAANDDASAKKPTGTA